MLKSYLSGPLCCSPPYYTHSTSIQIWHFHSAFLDPFPPPPCHRCPLQKLLKTTTITSPSSHPHREMLFLSFTTADFPVVNCQQSCWTSCIRANATYCYTIQSWAWDMACCHRTAPRSRLPALYCVSNLRKYVNVQNGDVAIHRQVMQSRFIRWWGWDILETRSAIKSLIFVFVMFEILRNWDETDSAFAFMMSRGGDASCIGVVRWTVGGFVQRAPPRLGWEFWFLDSDSRDPKSERGIPEFQKFQSESFGILQVPFEKSANRISKKNCYLFM